MALSFRKPMLLKALPVDVRGADDGMGGDSKFAAGEN
jgi:hypothetical protein